MKKKLKLYSVSDKYIAFLRTDKQLSNVYDNKEIQRLHTRKYLGVVIKKGDFNYFIPLSSPKNNDFIRDEESGELMIRKSIVPIIRITTTDTVSGMIELKGTLRVSHMIPVPEQELMEYDINAETDLAYKDLVEKEYEFVKANAHKIVRNAEIIYNEKNRDYGEKPKPNYLNNTIDFKYAEQKCKEFNCNNIFNYETVTLDENGNSVIIIDQTKLPGEIVIKKLSTAKEIWDAIYRLEVRGAPAIGVAAAMGISVLANQIEALEYAEFYAEFQKQKDYLNSSRPTAVNLKWALDRMEKVCIANKNLEIDEIKDVLRSEAVKIKEEDIEVCRLIGEFGLTLLKPGDGILTHCNAGQLATCKYGTATAPIYLGFEKGYGFKVFADETRPLLQGARLTAYELQAAGIDVTLICDNMSASVMQKGWVQAVLVGADRIAANGDTANKIGTAVVAAVAKQYSVPLYVCAPTSTIDLETKTGADIPIEERAEEEVTEMWYEKRMAPEKVKVFNPSFDVTANELIAGIVTEKGIVRAPYEDGLKRLFDLGKG